MASMEDAGAKRQLFYDIECVIEDCDGEAGYKPLSDSDEIEDSAEEDEPREEDIDSSEEWEPLMRRSKAKRQQQASPSAFIPRRRGRPPKNAPQASSQAPDRSSSPKHISDSSLPRRRGRPRKDKSKTTLIPKPTPYPTIIPKPTLYSTPFPNSIPTFKFSPNSTAVPLPNTIPAIKLSPNSSPIHTPNPASTITYSHNSTHVPLPNTIPSITFASNSSPTFKLTPNSTASIKLSPNSTPTSSPTPIATLICKPTQSGLLLDIDTNRSSDSWIEKKLWEEKVSSVEEWVAPIQQSPERAKSPTPIAKRQRLSSPSPPATTSLHRRGRPRKHTSKTVEPEMTSSPSVEPSSIFSHTVEPPSISNHTVKPKSTSNPSVEPPSISNHTVEPPSTSSPSIEPPSISNPYVKSPSISNPSVELPSSSSPTVKPPPTCNVTPTKPLAHREIYSDLDEDSDSDGIIDSGEEDLWDDYLDSGEDWNPLIEQSQARSTPASASSTAWGGNPFKHASESTSLQPGDMPSDSTSKPSPEATPELTPISNFDPTIPNPTLTSSCIPNPHPTTNPIPTLESTPTAQPSLSSRRRGRPPKHTLKPSKPTPEPTSTAIPNSVPVSTCNSKPISNPTPELAPTSNPIPSLGSKTTTELNPEAIPSSEAILKPRPTKVKSVSEKTSALDEPRVKVENAPEADKWHDITVEDEEPVLPDFCPKQPPGPQHTEAANTPLQLFQLFFTSSVIETIVRNTNSYAEKRAEDGKKFQWVPLTVKDFCSFVALIIYMGLVKTEALGDYWARKKLYKFSYPQSIMSRERFQAIFWNLYLCDLQDDEENNKKKGTPDYDRLLKIKPLYTDILLGCMTHFHPNREISIDERLDTMKARIGLKQFMNDKPAKVGFKLFVLTDSSSGYNWNFYVYEGKSSTSTGKGVAYDSVMRLLDLKLLGNGYRLYTDTFYTSPTLFRDLLQNNILACGTLRHTFSLPEANVLSKKADRGSFRWCRQGPLLFVKWMDVREIVTCSTMHKAFAGDSICRRIKGADGVWSLHQIPVPPAVKDWNRYMVGEDSSDALIGYYNVLYKTRKWFKTFFFHFLEIAVVNSFVLHQHMAKAQNKTPLSQKAFRETLISELKHVSNCKESFAPASTDPSTSVSDESTSPSSTKSSPPASPPHTEQCFPEYFGSDATCERKTCVMCKLAGNKVKTPVCCSHCKVALCFVSSRNCFKKWHIEGHSEDL